MIFSLSFFVFMMFHYFNDENKKDENELDLLVCKIYPIKFNLNNNWKLNSMDFLNIKNNFCARFYNQETKSQLIVRIIPDTTSFDTFKNNYSQISDSVMLGLNPKNKLIKRYKSKYIGKTFLTNEYLIHDEKFGWYKQISQQNLESRKFFSFQKIYSIKGTHDSLKKVPVDFVNLIKKIKSDP
ncbi:MAG: hypothetical protein V4622_14475 [Bacteroidota bacterium]